MTKAARFSEKLAKFCHSVRRHMSEDSGRRRRQCCENHDSHETAVLVGWNAQRAVLGTDLVSPSGRGRLEADRSYTPALLPFRNDIKQHVRMTTGNKLQKNSIAQIAFRLSLSPRMPCFASRAVHEGFRSRLKSSRTVPFATESISCHHYDPRHVPQTFVYYPCYWHWAGSCLISPQKEHLPNILK
jgi:hypothetical protein